ncbi:translesion DNA synthesis-associated protein ImuA [Uliginosibacterium flavum]|uniref:Translesion DNA synthesis-associated protein ImuA n=1 Tax=Uliginosibacterium flavum TaxID=1396831 RepID=A0ABV2TH57_9RHOO
MAAAAQIAPSLQTVLLRNDIWRGDRLAMPGEAGVASGFAALDAELPGGGWPRGALSELLLEASGIGELSLLQPVLQACAVQAPIALIAPPQRPHAPAWAAVLPLERLLLVEARGAEVAWAAEHLLASGALGALLVWLPAQIDTRTLRRLQMAAEGHPAPAFVFRPAAAARQASPAPLRLNLAGSAEGLQLRVFKRRGPLSSQTLCLPVARPVAQARLLARLAPAQTPLVAQAAWA